MKKILVSLLMTLVTVISIHAICVTGIYTAYDDGEYYGKIILTSDCKFIIKTVDGERFTGTYTIKSDERPQPGESYTLVFYASDGNTYYGQYTWPIYDGECVLLDGFLFKKE